MELNGWRETAQRRVSAAPARFEAGTLLLRAGTECENDRDNRAGADLAI
jgi:hypothetical protein